VTDAMVAASKTAGAKGLAMNIAGERPVAIREFINLMSDALGSPPPSVHLPVLLAKAAGLFFDCSIGLIARPPLTYAQVGYLTENRAFAFTRAQKIIGYAPKVGLREGLQRTVAWYRSRGLL
jgi:2-alkyl-3-oxoalkanoate reductase